MDWYQILTATGLLSGIQIIILLLIGYLLKQNFENRLAKTIEAYKQQLQKEVDNHQHELDKIKSKYEIQFDKFFHKKLMLLPKFMSHLQS